MLWEACTFEKPVPLNFRYEDSEAEQPRSSLLWQFPLVQHVLFMAGHMHRLHLVRINTESEVCCNLCGVRIPPCHHDQEPGSLWPPVPQTDPTVRITATWHEPGHILAIYIINTITTCSFRIDIYIYIYI